MKDIVDINGFSGTVALRRSGRKRRTSFKAGNTIRVQTKLTVDFQGRRRHILADLDSETGQLTVRLRGLRKSKTYTLADLFLWGPQLQLL